MLIDATLSFEATDVEADARGFETAGYDGIWLGETKRDPFLALTRAASVTTAPTIGTAVTIAFARNPMSLAYVGYEMAEHTRGRFVLGIGSQVKAHIERRFSMPWDRPAERMREYVAALRAIWASWQDGTRLNFEGEFYRHTLMTPFFAPAGHQYGTPPLFLAAVGGRMTEVAGECCDGLFFHAFTTPDYLRDVTVPAVLKGRANAGHTDLAGFTLTGPAFVAVGRHDAELDEAIRGTRQQIAFYASTPAYSAVLEHHGWNDLGPELTRLSKEGKWVEMGQLIDDDVLHAFAAVGDPATAAASLQDRWGDTADRITLYTPYDAQPESVAELLSNLKDRS